MDRRARPRWLEQIKAYLGGYFWLPCTLCREPYGGHEWNGASLLLDQTSGRVVCVNCEAEADRINRQRFPDLYGLTVAPEAPGTGEEE